MRKKVPIKPCKTGMHGLIGALVMGLLLGCGAAPVNKQAGMPDQQKPKTQETGTASSSPVDMSGGLVLAASHSETEPRVQKNLDSLWETNSDFGSLFVSQKAHHVGDIVTIRIVESSSASNQATTTTGRNSSLSITTPKFFGAESEVPEEWLFNPLGELGATFGSGFDGNGSTNRSGDLNAYITAIITEVLPNGNLKIIGTREVAINNEKQLIHLSGIIRSRDISTDNVILSTYIADARIEYSGKGVIDDRQKPGWLTSLFNKLWPF